MFEVPRTVPTVGRTENWLQGALATEPMSSSARGDPVLLPVFEAIPRCAAGGGGGTVHEPLGKGHVCTCPGPPGQASGGQQLQSFYSWFWLLSICHDCCIWPGKFFWYNGAPHLRPTLSRLVSYKAGSWIASGFNLLVILGLFDVSPSFRPGFEKGLFFFCDREMTRTQPYLSSKGSHICLLRAFSIQIHMMVFKGPFSLYSLSLECIFVSYSCSLWAHFYFIRM